MSGTCVVTEHLIRFCSDIPEKLQKHIASCKCCLEQMEIIKAFETMRIEGMDCKSIEQTEDCPEDSIYAAFLDGDLRGESLLKVRNHVIGCKHCLNLSAEFMKESHPAEQTIEELLKQAEEDSPKDVLVEVKRISFDFITKNFPSLADWFDESFENIKETLLAGKQLSTLGATGTAFTGKSKQTIPKSIIIIHEVLKELKADRDPTRIINAVKRQCKIYKADKDLQKYLLTYFHDIK